MALLLVMDPTPQGGDNITTSAGTEAVIKRGWANTFPNNNGSLSYNAYYGGQSNWHYRIVDSATVTPREGTHSFYAQALTSQPQWKTSGGDNFDRLSYSTGSNFGFADKEEVWFGWSVYFHNIGGNIPSGPTFHTVGDSHTVNAIGAACWTMWFYPQGTIQIFHRVNSSSSKILDYSGSGAGGWAFGTWMDFVVNVRRDYNGSTGKLNVWHRRWPAESTYRQLVNYTGLLGYGPPDGDNNFQLDSYISNGAPQTNIAWSRAYSLGKVRIGNANSSFAEVAPGQDQTPVATPVINPNGGTFVASQTVTLTCGTSGATISYTTDGTTPTSTVGTQVATGAQFALTATATVKAMAFKTGSPDSAVATATFTKQTPPGGTPLAIRINCGGLAFTDSSANDWIADQEFNGGSANSTTTQLSNVAAADQVLYQKSRFWASGIAGGYNVTTPNGDYKARFHFSDTTPSTQFVGGRVFDVAVEGEVIADNQDIFDLVGPNSPLVRARAITVSDGIADLALGPEVNSAKINGIELIPIGTAAGTGNALMEPAQVAANTSTGNQDITAAALSGVTPKAAILWWTNGTANGTTVAHLEYGIGITDGLTQFSHAIAGRDNVTTGASNETRAMTDRVICLIAPGGSVAAEASFVSFISNGIRINWTTAPPAGYRLNALFLAGSDIQAKLAIVSMGTSGTAIDINTAGFTPTDGIVVSVGRPANDASNVANTLSIGGFVNRASLTQRCLMFYGQNAQYPARAYMSVRTDAVGGELYPTTGATGELKYTLTVGAFDAQGCSITPTAGGGANGAVDSGDAAAVLLLRIDNVSTALKDFTGPTSTGANAVTGFGFSPASIMEVIGTVLSTDAVLADTEAAGFGLSAYSASGEYAASAAWDDNVSTTNGNSVAANKATHLIGQGATAVQIATLTSMDADGRTKNHITAAAAVKGFAWALQASATQQVVEPVIDPDGGHFRAASITVTITTTTAGASIRYTTDGSTPDEVTGTVYGGPFAHTSGTIKAIAYKSGLSNSTVTTAVFTFAQTVQTPVISPVTGTYQGPQVVDMATATPGATIYYTTDGSTPDATDIEYTGSFTVSVTTTLKAIAILASWTDSAVATSVITITGKVATPTISPPTGTYNGPQTVTIATTTPGASLRYTTDGSTPTATTGTAYSGPFQVSTIGLTQLRARGFLTSWNDSDVASSNLTITGTVATPVILPATGTYQGPQSVTMTTTTQGAAIYYTLDGSTPSASSTLYTGAFTVSAVGATTVKAIGILATWTNSAIATNVLTITGKVATPSITPATGTYNGPQSVTLATATPGASIRYTTDGSTPTASSTLYSGPFTVSTVGANTIKARGFLTNWNDSDVATETLTITGTVTTPVITPATGTYQGPQSVTITTTTVGASIYYTLDGSTPDSGDTLYTGAFTVSDLGATTIKAIGILATWTDSAVATSVLTITGTVETPVILPATGTYQGPQSVTITTTTAGADIYYTLDGSTPDSGDTLYTGAFTIAGIGATEVKAIAVLATWTDSAIASETLTITGTVETPVISPTTGTFQGPQSVTITCSTAGASIYYTLDGSTPDSGDTLYTGAFTVDALGTTTTVKAIAVLATWTDSAVATSAITITPPVAKPVISPVTGTYPGPRSVTITCDTAGAAVYYTTDGSTPDSGDTLYSGAFVVSATTTVKAIGILAGWVDSAVDAAVLTITGTVSTPVISPATGSFAGPQSVTITCATAGADIYYTTDGSDPDSGDTLYTGAFTVDAVGSTTVKAIGLLATWTDSAIDTSVITITPPLATPGIEPSTGTYQGPQEVTISTDSIGAAIYYTTDGTTPTEASTLYSGAFTVNATTIIQAYAVLPGYLDSDIGVSVITLTAPVAGALLTGGMQDMTGGMNN